MNRHSAFIRVHLTLYASAAFMLAGCQSKPVKTARNTPSPSSGQLLSPTQFFEAVQRKDTAQVKLLLANGADPNTRDQSGKALWKKSKSERYNGESPVFRGQTALMVASRQGDIATMKVLIAAKADVNVWGYSSNWNEDLCPLMEAIGQLKPDAVKLLIKSGADVNARDSGHISPLGLVYNMIPSSGEMPPDRKKRTEAISKALQAAGAKL